VGTIRTVSDSERIPFHAHITAITVARVLVGAPIALVLVDVVAWITVSATTPKNTRYTALAMHSLTPPLTHVHRVVDRVLARDVAVGVEKPEWVV
jgi:hypothetical protein